MVIGWDWLYSMLKATREGKDTTPMEVGFYREDIAKNITAQDILDMDEREIKEAVISFFEAINPDFKER
jgi:hypothetical protein